VRTWSRNLAAFRRCGVGNPDTCIYGSTRYEHLTQEKQTIGGGFFSCFPPLGEHCLTATNKSEKCLHLMSFTTKWLRFIGLHASMCKQC